MGIIIIVLVIMHHHSCIFVRVASLVGSFLLLVVVMAAEGGQGLASWGCPWHVLVSSMTHHHRDLSSSLPGCMFFSVV